MHRPRPSTSKRIICTGNALLASDNFGTRVYGCLTDQPLPPGVELIDGGLAGLDLLRFVEPEGLIVIVDALSGFSLENNTIVVMNLEEILATVHCDTFSHANGLAYFFHMIPQLYRDEHPAIFLVGYEGIAAQTVVEEAAAISRRLVS